MPEYSQDILFEKFLDFFELYLDLKNKLSRKRKETSLPQEEFEEFFYEEIDELERQKDLLQKVFNEYVRKMLTEGQSSDIM